MHDSLKVISSPPQGLRFKCTACGQCCTGAPGYIWVNAEEIQRIAKKLDLEEEVFRDRYLRRVDGRWSLKERSKSYDCIFLKDKKCSIYDERPMQCRTYPWWPQVLSSDESWKNEGNYCEGINHPDAEEVALEHILNEKEKQEKYLKTL